MSRPGSILRRIRIALWVAAGLMTVAALATGVWRWTRPAPAPIVRTTGEAAISATFSLVDHRGRAVTAADYRGKWLLVFFGYTNCPDVCPTTLNTVAKVLAKLGPDAAKVQPLFITVDPERDTPQAMAAYVAAFDPRIVGLTGSPQQIAEAARAFRVYYARDEATAGEGAYAMDHSAYLYLIGPEGRFETVFAFGDDTAKIVARIRKSL